MNNAWDSSRWEVQFPSVGVVTDEDIKNVKGLKMLAAQRQHIKKLQKNLEHDENNFFRVLTSLPGWELFITKHTSTYQRPKDVLPHLKNYFKNLDIEFDTEEGLPTKAKFIITYAAGGGYKSYQHLKFRTNEIPISDIEEFIQNKGY